MYRRKNGRYYLLNKQTLERKSLSTTDPAQAEKLLAVYNQTQQGAALNLELGRVFLKAANPELATRTWKVAMDELSSHGIETSQARCKREMESKAFDLIRDKPIIETTKEDLKLVLKRGGSAANHYLRRLHNLAFGNGWINSVIIAAKQWDKPSKNPKRGITFDEHTKIIAAEKNEERKHYYEMLWLIGAAQTDCSLLSDKNIDWKNRTIAYQRKKTGEWCHLQIGAELKTLLDKLPKQGFLFPKIALTTDKARSAEFCRRRGTVEVSGVSLHSYRYAWAERAAAAGFIPSDTHKQLWGMEAKPFTVPTRSVPKSFAHRSKTTAR